MVVVCGGDPGGPDLCLFEIHNCCSSSSRFTCLWGLIESFGSFVEGVVSVNYEPFLKVQL